jgi:tRNA pseudouridine38-40 synthase
MGQGIRLTIAYDGTDFSGWARQPGHRTVQGVLEQAASAMAGHAVEVFGASRTDAGVHALGQVAAFDPKREIVPYGWLRGLSDTLPTDVEVLDAGPVPEGYNPRFDAAGKHYRYLVQVGRARNPLMRHRVWHLPPGMSLDGAVREGRRPDVWAWLDVEAMRRAGKALVGIHDFRAFQASNDEREKTVRSMEAVEIETGAGGDPALLAIDVRGNAFLKNMVRIMVGTLVEVGAGRRDAESVPTLLGPEAARTMAGPTAPPHGLTLLSVTLGRKVEGR